MNFNVSHFKETTVPISRALRTSVIAIAAVLSVTGAWGFFGYPTSFDEAMFLRRLSSAASARSSEVKLAELMPGDWELVCWSHSYDGPLYLSRYNRTYEPAAPADDGMWGLIFIAKDGSYHSAVGSCGRIGAYLNFEPKVCIERSLSVLSIVKSSSEPCTTFTFRHG